MRQAYPDRELLVLNDCPGQELRCDAPDAFVINLLRRFHSYGEKLNAGIALAQGSLIALWNDDDSMLPWHLSKSLERLADAGYDHPQVYWFLDPADLLHDHHMGVGHICSISSLTHMPASSSPEGMSRTQPAAHPCRSAVTCGLLLSATRERRWRWRSHR